VNAGDLALATGRARIGAWLLTTVGRRVPRGRARREALQNAFKASGKTVAEFAEMYGVDPQEARKLLA
jgi:hypothetical protein